MGVNTSKQGVLPQILQMIMTPSYPFEVIAFHINSQGCIHQAGSPFIGDAYMLVTVGHNSQAGSCLVWSPLEKRLLCWILAKLPPCSPTLKLLYTMQSFHIEIVP